MTLDLSSYTLGFRDAGDMTDEERAEALRQIQELNNLLEAGRPARQPAGAR
jgi:hypothetical protein